MKLWGWKPEKNVKLQSMGRPSFEEVLLALEEGGYRDILQNPNYPDRMLLIVMINDYAHVVSFKVTLKLNIMFTVFPSRAYQKKHQGKKL